jgi:hypothetical protein
MTHKLTMIVRARCHLCDDMRDALAVFRDELQFTWHELDVDADLALLAQYHEDVPVLLNGEQEICHHFLDAVALRDALTPK